MHRSARTISPFFSTTTFSTKESRTVNAQTDNRTHTYTHTRIVHRISAFAWPIFRRVFAYVFTEALIINALSKVDSHPHMFDIVHDFSEVCHVGRIISRGKGAVRQTHSIHRSLSRFTFIPYFISCAPACVRFVSVCAIYISIYITLCTHTLLFLQVGGRDDGGN